MSIELRLLGQEPLMLGDRREAGNEIMRLRAELAVCRASHAVLEEQVSDMAQRLFTAARKGEGAL